MAATESNNDEGSDIFWPGYVDAVTNLVLNLLFVLTIMIVAVLMFAMALSRRHEADMAALKTSQQALPSQVLSEKEQKIAELEAQLLQLKAQSASVKNTSLKPQKMIRANTALHQPTKNLEKLVESGGSVIVSFAPDAVTLSETEATQVAAALKSIAAKGKAMLVIDVPSGFTEAKRLAFYRVMAVRNMLIELGAHAEQLEIKVRESGQAADNTKVIVSEGDPS